MSRPGQNPRRRRKSVSRQFAPNGAGIVILLALIGLFVGLGVGIPRWKAKIEQKSASQPEQEDPVNLPQGVLFPGLHFGGLLGQIHVPMLPGLIQQESQTPEFIFTPEEMQSISTMLDEWAEKETVITIDKDDEGEPLKEPIVNTEGGHKVALWYMDLNSGLQYGYNAGEMFSYASVMKAPYAAWLYTLASQGQLDLAQVITIAPENIGKYAENSGVIKKMELPKDFTVEELIGHMLESSDTVALRTLLNHYPATGFVTWAGEKGVQQPEALRSVMSGTISAQDAGVLALAVYDVMENNPYGPDLKNHMMRSGNRMIRSEHPVAHKYGWDENAYHDFAIVYAPHPYILVILTDKWAGSYKEQSKFGEISSLIESIVMQKWADFPLG